MSAYIYKCDPEKAKECKKTSCYIYGGPCYSTLDVEIALLDENGEPVKSDIKIKGYNDEEEQ
jgi:hypothetical protein